MLVYIRWVVCQAHPAPSMCSKLCCKARVVPSLHAYPTLPEVRRGCKTLEYVQSRLSRSPSLPPLPALFWTYSSVLRLRRVLWQRGRPLQDCCSVVGVLQLVQLVQSEILGYWGLPRRGCLPFEYSHLLVQDNALKNWTQSSQNAISSRLGRHTSPGTQRCG